MDRFQSIYSTERKTSKRIYVVRVETDKKAANNIQAILFYGQKELWTKLGRNAQLKKR